jgi:hypothetical protein
MGHEWCPSSMQFWHFPAGELPDSLHHHSLHLALALTMLNLGFSLTSDTQTCFCGSLVPRTDFWKFWRALILWDTLRKEKQKIKFLVKQAWEMALEIVEESRCPLAYWMKALWGPVVGMCFSLLKLLSPDFHCTCGYWIVSFSITATNTHRVPSDPFWEIWA